MTLADKVTLKSSDEIVRMARAGQVVHSALSAVRLALSDGVTTGDLDAIAEHSIREAGAVPSFLGYYGYPASVCVSINDEVVHGIPGDRRIEAGDVVSVDCGAILQGWHGDSAFTAIVDSGDANDLDLSEVCEGALWAGIEAFARAKRLGEVGRAIDAFVAGRFGILEDYVGHGIGRQMHEPPDVLNYATRDKGMRVSSGLCVAIEPMIVRGDIATRTLDDEWTVVTRDGARAAHWEHSVARLDDGIWVLTLPDGGAARLAASGLEVSPTVSAALS